MDEDLTPHRRHPEGRRGNMARPWNLRLALAVFGLLVLLAPLLFGAVDRAVQIGLVALFSVGLFLVPPRLIPLPVWMTRVMLVLMVILVAKELLPAGWFGAVSWRPIIEGSYALDLPGTHHPEPGRALDAWLVGALGVLWFAWVRTLAIERNDRAMLIWLMFAAATIVAVASFSLSRLSPDRIFGLRYTAGWFGFGPFPNRNHTGNYLAMSILLGMGCVAYAGVRRRFDGMSFGTFALIVLLAALFKTQSRGALVALALGIGLYAVVVVVRSRSGKVLALVSTLVLLLGAMSLVVGKKTLDRMAATGKTTDDSASLRVTIWKDTVTMWKDAPLLGHGASSFASIFPLYQNLAAEDVNVKHPESSFLQWLVELGLIPVMLGGVVIVAFVAPHVRKVFERRSSFYLVAGALGAVTVWLIHSLIDVPAHRWGTGAIALAALALVCPVTYEAPQGSTRSVLIPLGVVAYWTLPLLARVPAWSPLQLESLLGRAAMGTEIGEKELKGALKWFPLNPNLHLTAGDYYLSRRRRFPNEWQEHYRLAVKLVPSSWKICAKTAIKCRRVSPGMAMHYWQMAVERATLHRREAFIQAINDTRNLPSAMTVWSGYVDAHPDLALTFAEALPKDEGKAYFDLWWEQRGSIEPKVSDDEADGFVRLAPTWGTAEQIRRWVEMHPERRAIEYKDWAKLMLAWEKPEDGWAMVAAAVPEPAFPRTPPKAKREALKKAWLDHPDDYVVGRNYAQVLMADDDQTAADQVILDIAKTRDAPRWFLEKAAHIHARRKEYKEAIDYVLGLPDRKR